MKYHDESFKIVPYKIGKVSFVPSGGIIQTSKEVVTCSDMDESSNRIEIYKFDSAGVNRISHHVTENKITDLQWLNQSSFITSDTAGSIRFMKWNSPTGSNPHLTQTGNQIHEIQKWKKLKSRINAIGLLKGDDITGAVATESGEISLFTLNDSEFVRSYKDECSISCLTPVSTKLIISGNLFGQIKYWDIRSNNYKPIHIFDLPEYGISINSVTQHPGRTNLILGGTSDGNIYIWDIRKDKTPIVKLGNHSGRVNNVKFHSHRSMAVSCGSDGKMFSFIGTWDSAQPDLREKNLTPVGIYESINSVDICDDFLVAGGDDATLILRNI